MGAAENKDLVGRIFQEGMNEQRDGAFVDYLSAGYVNHDMPAPQPGPEGFLQVMKAFWEGFPDGRVEVEAIVADGDLVATRGVFTGTHKGEFMGVPASGATIRVPYMDMWRIENGKAVENWVRLDNLALMQQIGAVPSAPPAS
jgi:steroid delta-isomerase-like uncharacterized protein